MDLPETLALPRAKQESLHLQPRRVNLVHSESRMRAVRAPAPVPEARAGMVSFDVPCAAWR